MFSLTFQPGFDPFYTLQEKPYISDPEIFSIGQKDQGNIIFPSTFWLEKRPYFLALKSSKQELSIDQQIESFHQLFSEKKTVFPIFGKFKTRPFQ